MRKLKKQVLNNLDGASKRITVVMIRLHSDQCPMDTFLVLLELIIKKLSLKINEKT